MGRGSPYAAVVLKNYNDVSANEANHLTLSNVLLGDGLGETAIAYLGRNNVPLFVVDNSEFTLTGDWGAATRGSGTVEFKNNNAIHITEPSEAHGVHHLFDNLRALRSNDAQVSMDGGTLTLDVQGSSQAEIARNVMMASSGSIVKTGTGHLTVHDVNNPNVTWVYKEGGFQINADASLQGESNARPNAGTVSHVHMQGRKTDETTDAYSTNLELAGSVSFDHDVFESLDNGQGQLTVLSGTTNVRTTQSYQGRTDIRGGSLRLSTDTDGTNLSSYLGTSKRSRKRWLENERWSHVWRFAPRRGRSRRNGQVIGQQRDEWWLSAEYLGHYAIFAIAAP